jgi:hypothetical protein
MNEEPGFIDLLLGAAVAYITIIIIAMETT